jgi:hypothetical protein
MIITPTIALFVAALAFLVAAACTIRPDRDNPPSRVYMICIVMAVACGGGLLIVDESHGNRPSSMEEKTFSR